MSQAPLLIDKDPEIARLTALVKKDPDKNLSRLVEALVKGKKDDFERVRALHDWVALNIAYDVAAFRNEAPTVVEPNAVIRRGSSVCAGYAGVFAMLCAKAGIECQVIHGYGRGYGFNAFTEGSLPYASDHAWNAALIDGGWYLLDTTWDAGGADEKSFHRSYSVGYLFTPPEIFLCTHYPGDPRFQLREKPLSYDEFKTLPYLRGMFGVLGFARSASLQRVATTREEVEVSFAASPDPDVAFKAFLFQLDPPGSKVTSPVTMRRQGDMISLRVMFPTAGSYGLSLHATRGDDARTTYSLGSLYFVAAEGSKRRLPYTTDECASAGLSLDAGNGYLYKVGSTATFSFSYPGDPFITLSDASYRSISHRCATIREGNHQTVMVSFPQPGEYTVSINLPSKEKPDTLHCVASLSYLAQGANPLAFPSIRPEAVRGGLSLDALKGYNPQVRVGAETRVTFTYPRRLLAGLYNAKMEEVRSGAILSRDGERGEVRVRCPSEGEYTLWIMTPSPTRENRYEGTASMLFSAK